MFGYITLILKLFKIDWKIIVALIVIIGGLYAAYSYGKKVMYDSIQVEIMALKSKVDKAEIKSNQVTVQTDNKVTEIKKKIETKTNTVIQYIDREITKYDNTCIIPKEVIKAHNDAARDIE